MLPFAPDLILDPLGCAERSDTFAATKGGNQEVVSFFRQLIDDVLNG